MMLSQLCRRALGHMLTRSRAIKRVQSFQTPRILCLNSTICLRNMPPCAYLSTVSHNGSPGTGQSSVDEVLQRLSRQKDWLFRPIESSLSALRDTDKADRTRNCLAILSVYRGIAAGRAITSEHLDEIWKLVTDRDQGPFPMDAILQCLRLYTDSALPPPPALAALATEQAEDPELAGQLVHCLCAAGRLEEAAPLLDRLRAAGQSPPRHALHAVIVAHAANGDLDTARDMAQALLPAAAEDDSDYQLLQIRIHIAARRPGPLSGLLSRWYEQRGQLTIAQSISLLEALVNSDLLDQLQQVVPLVPWPRYGHHRADCVVRLQRRLVRLGRPQVALQLISTALSEGGAERDLVRLARALLVEMAVTEQPVSAMAEVCAALSGGPLLPTAWFVAAELLYRLGRWRPALQLLLVAHRAGVPLREHLFWPALLQQASAGDVEGVRCTLSEMVSAGVPPGLETLRDYALPVYLSGKAPARPPSELIVQHLKEAGVTAAAAADALVGRLLASRDWHQAAAVSERYSGSVSVPVLVSAILHALQLQAPGGGGPSPSPPAPVDACVRLLRCAFARRASHEDPVGAVLMEMTQAAGRSSQSFELLHGLLQAAGPAGLRVSPAAAELACERLQSSVELAQLQQLMLQLADDAVSSRPWESLEAGAGSGLPQDASVEELEDHLVELTKKGGNTRGILRKLVLMHCRKHNLDRALALEEELTRVSDSVSDGEPLTPGLLAALLAVHVHHGRLEEALGYKRRLERHPDAARFLDQFKRVDLATLLVRRGHSEDALSLLEQLQPESDGARLSMGCWRLLAAAADWGDVPLATRLLRLLQEREVVTLSSHHWGQLVRAHIVSGDVSGAVSQFCRCAQEQQLAGYSHGLLLEVVRLKSDDQRRQLLDDLVHQLEVLHGPDSAQYDLALALSQVGQVSQARLIMQALRRDVHFTEGRLKRHCNRLSKAGQVDALVRLLQTVPHREARLAVYWALLNSYERTADLASVEDVLEQLETGEVVTGKIVNHARQLADRLRGRQTAAAGHTSASTAGPVPPS